ncbi:hypothetical protein [Amycolatopsis methanolica]|uniref:hypothetical protein n=1 Tax=Amycolatopsis methanolica TaxID=1814 RepID=UPI00342936A6
MTHIECNGDVHESIMMLAEAVKDEPHLIRLHVGSAWNQPEKRRRKVRIRARSLTVGGTPGPEPHVTRTWGVHHQVVLPRGVHAVYKPVGTVATRIEAGHDALGRSTFTCSIAGLPHHETVGMRLQLS